MQCRIQEFPRRRRQPERGANLLFGHCFPEKFMEMKKFWWRGLTRQYTFLGSTNYMIGVRGGNVTSTVVSYFPFTLIPTFFQSFPVLLEQRIQVRAGDFLGIHYPFYNRSAVPYRFGEVQATRHHKFTTFHEDLFVNYSVTPAYTTSRKRPALKAYVKGTFFILGGHYSLGH